MADVQEAFHRYQIHLYPRQSLQKAHCVILAVSHSIFIKEGWNGIMSLLEKNQGVVLDVKNILPKAETPVGIMLWRL